MYYTYKKILLTGGSGKLVSAIKNSRFFPNLLTPIRKELDITNEKIVKDYIGSHNLEGIIHTAALVDLATCERNPIDAITTNIVGTANLIRAVLAKNKNIRFLFISTDQLYDGIKGNFKETDLPNTPNKYGWTKLGAECAVNILPNSCIIRTSFFIPENVIKNYDDSPDDMYSSKLEINELVKNISIVYSSNMRGLINIGDARMSNYERFSKYKPSIKRIKFKEVQKRISGTTILRDASLDSTQWKNWLK